MTKRNDIDHDDLIETAQPAAADAATSAEPPAGDPVAAWRQAQAVAIKHRLEQLQMARSSATPAVRPTVSNVAARAGRPGWTNRRLIILPVLVLIGAAVMWWPMRQAVPTAESEPAQAVPPPAVPLAPTTEAALSASPVDDREAQVRALIERWRLAWMRRDVEAYLASYGPSFEPTNGQSLAAWRAARRKNLSRNASISVAVDALRTEPVSETQMAAFFLQDYASPSLQEKAAPKTLLLERIDGDWKIAGEWSGAFRIQSARQK